MSGSLFEEFTERPHFNVAPSQQIPVVRVNREGKRTLDFAQWGLIPSWTKNTPKAQPINARAETLADRAMFRSAFERRRCLIPADGFYEWKADPSGGGKQPWFFHFKDDRIFAFAGLWERWKPGEGAEPVDTCTIITTTPNAVVKPIHDRMPVILARENYDQWLDRDVPSSEVVNCLRPHPADEMEAYRVSKRVNRAGEEGMDLATPIE